jgi:hypothetical protein
VATLSFSVGNACNVWFHAYSGENELPLQKHMYRDTPLVYQCALSCLKSVHTPSYSLRGSQLLRSSHFVPIPLKPLEKHSHSRKYQLWRRVWIRASAARTEPHEHRSKSEYYISLLYSWLFEQHQGWDSNLSARSVSFRMSVQHLIWSGSRAGLWVSKIGVNSFLWAELNTRLIRDELVW